MALTDRKANPAIAEALRTRVCLHNPDRVFILHEGKIAEEFGVSRTPIRQVLQLLAHEQLVETRAGIGTIAEPLDEGMFERDLKTAQSMLVASAAVCQHPAPADIKFSLMALSAMSKEVADGSGTRDMFMGTATRFLNTLVPIITDPLIEHAYRASFFRIIRWRLRMYRKNPTITWARLIALIDAAAAAADSDEPGAIFQAMHTQAISPRYAPWGPGDTTAEDTLPSNVHNIR